MTLAWEPLKADQAAGTYLLEFSYFDEFVLKHAITATGEKLISEDPVGSHNLRVGLALSMLERQLALAIQALWETNLRRWLRECVAEVRGDDTLAKDIKRRPLEGLSQILTEVRATALSDIPGGDLLIEATLVGNVVRHGDGPSAARLLATAPELWRNPPNSIEEQPVLKEDCADELMVSADRLRRYAEAVSEFWVAVSKSAQTSDLPGPPWASATVPPPTSGETH